MSGWDQRYDIESYNSVNEKTHQDISADIEAVRRGQKPISSLPLRKAVISRHSDGGDYVVYFYRRRNCLDFAPSTLYTKLFKRNYFTRFFARRAARKWVKPASDKYYCQDFYSDF